MFLLYFTGNLCIITFAAPQDIDSSLRVFHFAFAVITPTGSLIRALFVGLNVFSTACQGEQFSPFPSGLMWYGGPLLYLALQSIALFALLLFLESGEAFAIFGLLKSIKTRTKVDSIDNQVDSCAPLRVDGRVAQFNEVEMRDITSISGGRFVQMNHTDSGLRVSQVTKRFGKTTVAENLCFDVSKGETFALLGPNGAGKSTTVSLIRGDISLSSGEIFVNGISVRHNRDTARSHLGVCPQLDAIDHMTVIEHLQFYAKIRGVPDVQHNVQEVIRAVGLQGFDNRMAKKLSGGNKRKLSLAIALMGNPSALLLDEPSAGMDAASKRAMWNIIAFIASGRSILLTTHSMEEADALASRVGIMAKRMLAVGTSDELRQGYGDMYFVHLVLRSGPHTTDEDRARVEAWMKNEMRGAEKDGKSYFGQMRFCIPGSALPSRGAQNLDGENKSNNVGMLFRLLDSNKEFLGLEFYSISPVTLDHVFLKVMGANGLADEAEEPIGC
jgi:ATP-binding cassette, subfamily A (ABC1), member 3